MHVIWVSHTPTGVVYIIVNAVCKTIFLKFTICGMCRKSQRRD